MSLPDDLPVRPRSAFAAPRDDTEAKPERKGGRFTKEYWDDAKRKEQSEKAKQLIKEGRFGGAAGFHRRKTKKLQEIAAEHAQARADEIIQKLDAMIFGQHKDKRLQLEAIREYTKYEDWSVKNSREDEKEYRAMTNQQLDARLLDILGEAMGMDLAGVVDADVVDEEDLAVALIESGEAVDEFEDDDDGD